MRNEEVHGVLRSLHDRIALLETRAPTGGRSVVYSGGRRFQYARDRESASRSFARPSNEEMLIYFLGQVERLMPNEEYGGYTFAQLVPLFWQSNYYRYQKDKVLSQFYGIASFREAITSVWYSNASDPLKETQEGIVREIIVMIWARTFQPPPTAREVILKCFLDKVRELRPDREIGEYTYSTIIPLFWRCDDYLQDPEEILDHLFGYSEFDKAFHSVWLSIASDPLVNLEPGIVEDIMGKIWTFTVPPPAH